MYGPVRRCSNTSVLSAGSSFSNCESAASCEAHAGTCSDGGDSTSEWPLLEDVPMDAGSSLERFKMAVCLDGDLRSAAFFEDIVMTKLKPFLDRGPAGQTHDLIALIFGGLRIEALDAPIEGTCNICGSHRSLTTRLISETESRVCYAGTACAENVNRALAVLECLQVIRDEVNDFINVKFAAFLEKTEVLI